MGLVGVGGQLPFPQEGTRWSHRWSQEDTDCNGEEAVAARAGGAAAAPLWTTPSLGSGGPQASGVSGVSSVSPLLLLTLPVVSL